jgi:hypothetical protein
MRDWSGELRTGVRKSTAYGTSMSDFLKLFIAALAVSEVCIGSVVIRKLFAGIFLEQWANTFMRCCLAASILALLSPFHTSMPMHRIAISAMIVIAVATLTWGQFHWSGISILVSALSIILIICLNFMIAVGCVFDYMSDANLLPSVHDRLLFIIVESAIVLVFMVVGGVLIRTFDDEKIHLL